MERAGLTISSPIVELSSRPANAKVMVAKKVSVEKSVRSGARLEAAKSVALPTSSHTQIPLTARTKKTARVAIAPTL